MNKKHLIKVLGDTLSFAVVINFYIWLLVAMFNDGIVNVQFNHFNEALLEYIVYIIILPIITYSVIVDVKAYKKRKHLRKTHERPTTNL